MSERNIRLRIAHYFLMAVGCLLAFAGRAQCSDSLSPSVVASFPKNISELAYSDFSHARQYPWFAQFKQQTLPIGFNELEHFLASAGVNPAKQIDEIAWALMAEDDPADAANNAPQGSQPNEAASGASNAAAANAAAKKGTSATAEDGQPALVHHKLPEADDLLAVALGNFDPDATEAILEKNKVPSIELQGYTLYACGSFCHDFYFVFLDSGTLAFGKPVLLEHLLEVRSGAEESVLSNQVLFPLIHQVNHGALFWGVLNDAGTAQALHQLIPEAANFPDVSPLISKMRSMTIRVEGDDELNAEFEVSAAGRDAVSLSQLMQAGLLFRQFQASQDDPQFAKILQNITIAPGGAGIQVNFDITSEQMSGLLQRNTFSPKN